MQTFRIQADQRSYTVVIEPKEKKQCRATINCSIFDCACERLQEIAEWTVTKEGARSRAKSRSIGLEMVEVWVGGLPFQFSVTHIGPRGLGQATKATPRVNSSEIRAIMPGRVTSILVESGEKVSVGTPLLILEAMKMQNEIVSHKSGRVASVRVQEGATVKKDTVLIEIR